MRIKKFIRVFLPVSDKPMATKTHVFPKTMKMNRITSITSWGIWKKENKISIIHGTWLDCSSRVAIATKVYHVKSTKYEICAIWQRFLILYSFLVQTKRGVHWVRLNPTLHLLISYENEIIWSQRDQIISFSLNINVKRDKISKANPPHPHTYEPPFKKSWICPWFSIRKEYWSHGPICFVISTLCIGDTWNYYS